MKFWDTGSTGSAIKLRQAVRREARRQARRYDQVALGTVLVVRDGGATDVAFDGFGAGPIQATWALGELPFVGDRVVVVSLPGGQSWFVVGKLAPSYDQVATGEVAVVSGRTVTVSSADRVRLADGEYGPGRVQARWTVREYTVTRRQGVLINVAFREPKVGDSVVMVARVTGSGLSWYVVGRI